MFTAAWEATTVRQPRPGRACRKLTQLAIGLHPIQENSESVMLTLRVYPAANNTTGDEANRLSG